MFYRKAQGSGAKCLAVDRGSQHLKRYVAEFDFRYNNRIALGIDDFTRTVAALGGIKGKRLMYSQASDRGEGAV